MADAVACEDTRTTAKLMSIHGLRASLLAYHDHNAERQRPLLLARLARGEAVALVSDAGTPLLSDPGARVVEAVLGAGHRVVPIPGPSAILAALVASGLPSERFVFLGFPPRKGGERRALLERVARSEETVVLFESPQRVVDLLEALAEACGPDRRAAAARELTKVHEEVSRGTLLEVAAYYREHPPRGEVTIVVAPASEADTTESIQEDARQLASRLLAEGLKPSEAAKELAARLALARNDAYRVVQEASRDSE